MTDLADLTLAEAAAAVRTRQASAAELLAACWDQMDRANPAVNATIWTDRPRAEAAARAADAAVAAGAALGKLHGVPMAHKDM